MVITTEAILKGVKSKISLKTELERSKIIFLCYTGLRARLVMWKGKK